MAPLSREDIAAIRDAAREEKPAVITERARFSWPVLVVLIGVSASVVGMGALARAAGEDAGIAKQENKEQDKRLQALEVQAAETKAVLERLEKKVDRIDAKLDAK